MAEKKKFKIGIIGTGWIAESHVEAYKRCDDVEIVAAADLIPGKAEKFMAHYGIEGVHFYKDHKELIDNEPDLDGVSICTYNTQHAGPAIYCMEHNIPVLLEKPFCVTQEEAEAVIAAEKKSTAFITHGFQPRFDPNMQMIKRIVESGALGKIYYIQTGGGRRRGIPGSTFIEKSTGGIGALGDIGCYSLDMVLNAIGYPKPLTVTGYTSDYFGKNPKYTWSGDAKRFSVDDFAAAFVRLEGGIILDFRISWAMHMDTSGDALILGTKGGMRIPSTDCWNGEFDRPLTIYKTLGDQTIEYEVPLKPAGDVFYKKLRSFVDAIKEGGEAPVSSSEIIYNQAIIDGIARSAALGKEIEIEIPEI